MTDAVHTLDEALRRSARRVPERVAFRCGTDQLTYAELDARVDDAARTLVQCKVKKGDAVAVFLNRSIEVPLAIYAVMRAGAMWVPLNPRAPVARSVYQLRHARCRVVLTNAAVGKFLRPIVRADVEELRVIQLDARPDSPLLSDPGVAPAAPPQASSSAYVIYTSGSTGEPKGIVHTHASGLAFARNLIATFNLTEDDVLGGHAPVFFDVSQLALFAGPLLGATSALATEAQTIFPASLAAFLATGITVWYSVPLVLTQLVAAGAHAGHDWSALRWCLYAGEPCPPVTLRSLMTAWPDLRVANLYGPAETNVCTTYTLPGPPPDDRPIPIGRVWQDTDYFLDDGELYITTTTQMKGYLHRPDLDERAFKERAGRRYYRTGDIVEERAGVLHFLGRRDGQVKIRGYRVEVGAVEAELRAYPDVAEVAVVAGLLTDGTQALRAAVVPGPGCRLSGPELCRQLASHVKNHLPPYAVPQRFVSRPELPRTGSGKIDRPAVRAQLFSTDE